MFDFFNKAALPANAIAAAATGKLIPLENDSSMALTDAYFYTPSEQKIDRVGILPDVCLSGREENDSLERIVSRRFDDCPPKNRQNAEIDVETARLLLNKNL